MMRIPTQLALAAHLITILLYPNPAAANVEKTIFVAPSPQPVPAESPTFDDLGLERLSPGDFMLRTDLNASFPTHDTPFGTESWFYLEDLNPGQRYEVRICWLATQPTSFTLNTYSLSETVSDPSLLTALTKFSEIRLSDIGSASSLKTMKEKDYRVPDGAVLYPPKARHQPSSGLRLSRNNKKKKKEALENEPLASTTSPSSLSSQVESVLFLRIFAAADYFTTNSTLMANVPAVTADIILDPFILNVFPRSLVPTAVYTVFVAVPVYFIGAYLARTLSATVTAAAFEHRDGDGASEHRKLNEVKKGL